jgi:hypothetical protein
MGKERIGLIKWLSLKSMISTLMTTKMTIPNKKKALKKI